MPEADSQALNNESQLAQLITGLKRIVNSDTLETSVMVCLDSN